MFAGLVKIVIHSSSRTDAAFRNEALNVQYFGSNDALTQEYDFE